MMPASSEAGAEVGITEEHTTTDQQSSSSRLTSASAPGHRTVFATAPADFRLRGHGRASSPSLLAGDQSADASHAAGVSASPINIPYSPSGKYASFGALSAAQAGDQLDHGSSHAHPHPLVRRAAAAGAMAQSGGHGRASRLRRASTLSNEVISGLGEAEGGGNDDAGSGQGMFAGTSAYAPTTRGPEADAAMEADDDTRAATSPEAHQNQRVQGQGPPQLAFLPSTFASSSSPALAALQRHRASSRVGKGYAASPSSRDSASGSASPLSSAASHSVPWNEGPLAPAIESMDDVSPIDSIRRSRSPAAVFGERATMRDEDMLISSSDYDMVDPASLSPTADRARSSASPISPSRPLANANLASEHSSASALMAAIDASDNTAMDPPGGRRSTSASPYGGAPQSAGTRSGVVRRPVRRGNLAPKDRSIMRVAATLQDESRPTDSELASEAKLARKLCGEDAPVMPPISRHVLDPGNLRAGSPLDAYHGPGRGFAFGRRSGRDASMSPSRDADAGHADSATSDEDLCMATSYQDREQDSDEGRDNQDANTSGGGLEDSTDSTKGGLASSAPSTTKRGSLWMGFRDAKTRQSPGSERLRRARTPGAASSGSVDTDQFISAPLTLAGMMGTSATSASGSPGFVGRSAKRKMGGDERFDPYTSSAYKRRAVSPATLILGNGAQHPLISPSLSATPSSSALGAASTTGLPNPTPLSIPSPTIGFSAGLPGSSGGRGNSYFATHFPSRMSIGSGSASAAAGGSGQQHMSASRSSRSGSPATRPSTPTGAPPPFNAYSGGAGPSPGMLSSSAGKSGSGPGYGSGALGLSISGNSAALGLGLGRSRGASLLAIDDEEEAVMDDGVGAMRLNNEGDGSQTSTQGEKTGHMQ